MKLHERCQIGKAHVVRARRHALNRATGATASIHTHIQTGGLKVAFGNGLQKQRCGPFKAPVQLEFDGRCSKGSRGAGKAAQSQNGLQKQTLGLHGELPLFSQ